MDISIVIPVLNEEKNIPLLYGKIVKVMSRLNFSYEVIFVDDGSTDNSFRIIEELNTMDKKVKAISFRKNFGKASTLSAGFEKAKGEIIITMDGDLQDDPEDIPRFIEKINQGYDFVNGWKTKKHLEHSLVSMTFSKIFNKLTKIISGVNVHDFNCPFKAYKKEVAKSLYLYGNMHRYVPLLVNQEGYKIGEIIVKNHPRKYGKGKYGAGRLLKGFLDLITAKYLVSFMRKPLYLFGTIGLLCSTIGMLIGAYLLIIWFLGQGIGDRPLLMLSVLLIVLGIQLISLGLLGEMLVSQRRVEDYNIKKELGD